jgi:hypothetical protein
MATSSKKTGESPGSKLAGQEAGTVGESLFQSTIDRNVTRLLDDVVEQAVERIQDEKERSLVKEGVAAVVRDTLVELAESEARRQMLSAGLTAATSGDFGQSAEVGIHVAKQVKDIGFTEFTAQLIKGTFDTIVATTIEQMKAYAELVKNLAKTLADFRAENVSEAEVQAFLVARFPDGEGGTLVQAKMKFPEVKDDAGEVIKTPKALFDEVVASLKQVAPTLASEDLGGLDSSGLAFTQPGIINTIKSAIGLALASDMLDHLRQMARDGMARIVVTHGRVSTRLTFKVVSTEVESKHKSDYQRRSFGAGIRGSASWGWGRVAASASYGSLSVSTVNESNFSSLTMSTEMIGEVDLNFRTESFPTFEPPLVE